MQPYFFPYIGYFQLMNLADKWIVFDDIQYIDKGWINRNRILHPDCNKKWQYITVPLKNRGQFDKISDVKIDNESSWKNQILGKLTSYKRKAPFYNSTMNFVSTCLDTSEDNLSVFTAETLKKTARYLGIETSIDIQSELDLSIKEATHPGQWALHISEALDASEYINPIGGSGIFEKTEFVSKGIDLKFIRPLLQPYIQRQGEFTPALSIIDTMMWVERDEIKEMLGKCYELE